MQGTIKIWETARANNEVKKTVLGVKWKTTESLIVINKQKKERVG